MKNNKGITLIVLVITIVVLIILAGVSINLVLGQNGLLEKTKYSKFASNFAEIEEKAQMYMAMNQISNILQENSEMTIGNKMTIDEKKKLREEKTELEYKITEKTGELLGDVELYWIDQTKIGSNKKERYIIDIKTNQIYMYEGEIIYGQIWHTLDSGVTIGEKLPPSGEDDLGPIQIQIIVAPFNKMVTEINIAVDYKECVTKQYRIGETDTWKDYTEEIKLTSQQAIDNNLKNADNTISFYAKGIDSEGKQRTKKYIIRNLDVDMPNAPQIDAAYGGYPMLTSVGITYGGETNIVYDSRTDIDNYYSTDNKKTWKKYEGTFNKLDSNMIYAKSVKKESGLEVVSSKQVNMAADALTAEAYDEDINSSIVIFRATKKIKIDESIWNKKINIQATTSGNSNTNCPYIFFMDKNGTEIKRYMYAYNGTLNTDYDIPENTEEIRFYAQGNGSMTLKEVKVANQPNIKDVKYHAISFENGIQRPYNTVSIEYYYTSIQRLYKIDNGEWLNYENKDIKLEIGQTIYAKGIDKDGKETVKTSNYTSVLISNSLGINAYDNNLNTNIVIFRDSKIIKVDKSSWNKKINVQATTSGNSNTDCPYIFFKDKNGTEIKRYMYAYNGTLNTDYEIPENTDIIEFYARGNGSITIKEISIK